MQAEAAAEAAVAASREALQEANQQKLLVDQVRQDLAEQMRRAICATPPYWKYPSTDGTFLEIIDVTEELEADVQRLLDMCTDEGGTKIGIGRDANGMTHKSFRVVKVERIENAMTYSAYHAFKSRVPLLEPADIIRVATDKCKGCQIMRAANLDRRRNEKYLFHGCQKSGAVAWRFDRTGQAWVPRPDILQHGRDLVERISSEGFEESVARLSCMLGAGCYFAEFADKADRYAERYSDVVSSAGEQATIFLARVCLGKPYVTKPGLKGLRRPPCRHGHFDPPEQPGFLEWVPYRLKRGCVEHHDRHHSVVTDYSYPDGKPRLYREFVVHKGQLAYPEYRITYERR